MEFLSTFRKHSILLSMKFSLLNLIFTVPVDWLIVLLKSILESREQYVNLPGHSLSVPSQNMKFSIKDFFSECDQIHRKLRFWSHLLKKSLMENFIFCAVCQNSYLWCSTRFNIRSFAFSSLYK